MADIQFTPEQQAAIAERGGDLLVSAAAGSGKTRVLVERLMDQVEDGANVGQFLILTYTRAAAAELRSRISDEISRRSGLGASKHLRRQRDLIYQADMGTIHAFCAKIVREFAHVLDIQPDFRVADESEARSLLRQVLEDVLEARYGAAEADSGFSLLADTLSEGRRDGPLAETVLEVREKIRSHPYPEGWARAQLAELEGLSTIQDAGETVWGGFLLQEAKWAVDYWRREMTQARETLRADEKLERAYGPSWDETLVGLTEFSRALQAGWDEVHAFGEISFPRAKAVTGWEAIKDLRRRCKSAMDKLSETFALPTQELLDDMMAVAPVIDALVELTLDVDQAYTAEKTRRGMLDFSDLEHLAVSLLVDRETGGPTPAAQEIADRYQEVMVDEFQDVSAIQEKIFCALGEYGLRRFLVGDVKQSIYRFRLADPGIFLGYYRRFPDREQAESGQGRTVLLGKNFRSRPEILDAVNFIFRRIMSEDFGEMAYGDREALYPGRVESEAGGESPVELAVLDLKDLPKDESHIRDMAEARHVAMRIRELHDQSGYNWGDFAILLRSVRGKQARYEKALEELGIPVAKSGGEGFFYTVEVATILSLLQIISNPRQDVPLIGVLRSPLFCFTPDELAEIRVADRVGSFYEVLIAAAEDSARCAQFLQNLDRWRDISPDMAADQFLWQIYNETGALSVFGAMPGGETRRRNLMALLTYAQRVSNRGYKGLFDVVALLEKGLEAGDVPEMAASRDGGDVVQIVSVHKSKGLEFPVVILPDLAKRFNIQDTTRQILVHSDLGIGTIRRDMKRKIRYSTLARSAIGRKLRKETLAEELRILYVAMTRAREKLILTAALSDLEKTLAGLAYQAGDPVSPYVLEGAANMAEWILLPAMTRPEGGLLRGEHPVPLAKTEFSWDIIRPQYSGCDQRMGNIEKNIRFNHNQTQKIEPDPEFIKRIQYVYPYPVAVNLPSKLTATERKGLASDQEAGEDAIPYVRPAARPPIFRRPGFVEAQRPLTAARRGTATHLVMQYIDFQRCDNLAGVEAEIERLEREGRIKKEEAQAVDASAIRQFFESDLGQRLRASPHVRREFKFSLLVPASEFGFADGGEEKILLQGVVDCYLEEPDGLVIVDFKTDAISPDGLADKAREYGGQMEAYAYALGRITGRPVKEALLYFFSAGVAASIAPREL